MKLIKAKFTNFRMLRDITIDFSQELEKPLTIIRAENESGKTHKILRLGGWENPQDLTKMAKN